MTTTPAAATSPTALITGATAGIGAEFARQLAGQGHNLILVARDEERLRGAAEDLQKRYGINAEVLPADLTDDGAVAAVVERLSDPSRPVEVLVNNAGTGLVKPFDQNSIDDEKNLLKLHVETSMELCHAALQGMLERGSGRIINVSSVAAILPRDSYGAAKAWLLSFSRWANAAYKRRGVKVTALCPGFTHTEFHDRLGVAKGIAPGFAWLTPDRVVREGLADNEAGKPVSIPSKRYKVLTRLGALIPPSIVAGRPWRAK